MRREFEQDCLRQKLIRKGKSLGGWRLPWRQVVGGVWLLGRDRSSSAFLKQEINSYVENALPHQDGSEPPPSCWSSLRTAALLLQSDEVSCTHSQSPEDRGVLRGTEAAQERVALLETALSRPRRDG